MADDEEEEEKKKAGEDIIMARGTSVLTQLDVARVNQGLSFVAQEFFKV